MDIDIHLIMSTNTFYLFRWVLHVPRFWNMLCKEKVSEKEWFVKRKAIHYAGISTQSSWLFDVLAFPYSLSSSYIIPGFPWMLFFRHILLSSLQFLSVGYTLVPTTLCHLAIISQTSTLSLALPIAIVHSPPTLVF